MIAALLWMTMSDADAKPISHPDVVAQVTATAVDGQVDVVLTGIRKGKGRVLPRDPAVHRDPVTTMLEPRLERGDAEVYQVTGYRLSRLNDPGDVRVTYTLLVEVPEAGGPVWAMWWEDHMEIPTSLWVGEGTLTTAPRGASQLVLDLKHTDYGDALRVEGLIRVE